MGQGDPGASLDRGLFSDYLMMSQKRRLPALIIPTLAYHLLVPGPKALSTTRLDLHSSPHELFIIIILTLHKEKPRLESLFKVTQLEQDLNPDCAAAGPVLLTPRSPLALIPT